MASTCNSPAQWTERRGPGWGRSENRVRLAPHLRRSFQTFPHSWSPDDCEPCASVSIAATCRGHDLEAALRAAVTTEASVAVVGRAAFRCPRAHVVQDKRAARVHVFVSRFAGTMQPTDRTEIASSASHVFPAGTSRLRIQIQASHHRAFHAGGVLGVVNAPSLRPGRRPGLRALMTPPRGTCLALTRW